MLKWGYFDNFKYHDLGYTAYDVQVDEAEAGCYPCPECETGTMRPGPWDEYGADRDGRRGIRFRVFRCNNCEHEEERRR